MAKILLLRKTTMKPLVSVVVPVYNSEKYLESTINSLLVQELTEIGIICVDDGSEDNSLNM